MTAIALLTDFGQNDPFVGLMKSVIVQRAPGVPIIDLTHGIAAQAVDEAAFWLERCVPFSPLGTVHVAVVDPGVGSARRALALSAAGHFFVGPDNGLFSAWLDHAEVRAIDVARHGLQLVSKTFHGRDVFAPVAARLASGALAFADVGASLDPSTLVRLPRSSPRRDGEALCGEIVLFDRYGNAFTSIDAQRLSKLTGDEPATAVARAGRFAIVPTYAARAEGEAVALLNAFNVLELAVVQGSARDTLALAKGDYVVVTRDKPAG